MRTGMALLAGVCLVACGGKGGDGRDATGADSNTGLTTTGASGTTDGSSATATATESGTSGTSSASASASGTTDGTTDASASGTDSDPTTTGGCNPFCADVGQPPTKLDVPPETCGEANYSLDTVPPNVLLVLDSSGSMVNTALYWDHDDNPNTATVSRWYSLFEVVTFIADTFDLGMNLGMLFYPQIGLPKDCAIANTPEVPVGPMQGAAVKAALPPQNAYDDLWQNPTPTCDALEVAYAHLNGLPPGNPPAVVLVTDGVPSNATCPPDNDYPTCISRASTAFNNDGIPTYLVGIDISAGVVPDFNDLADAGGVPKAGAEKFYNSKNQIELQMALEQIAGQVLSCIAPLDPPPDDPNMVQVQLDGQIVPPVTDCANEDGWVYVNPNGPYDAIELCGTWCDDFKSNMGEILALYGCPPEG